MGSPIPNKFPFALGSLSYQYQSALEPKEPPFTDKVTFPAPHSNIGLAVTEVADIEGTSIPTIISLETASSHGVTTFLL